MLNKVVIMTLSLLSFGLNATGLNDPTRPAIVVANSTSSTTEKIEKEKLVLQSIKINEQSQIAVINQQNYRVGQTIGQEKIKQILSDKVIFTSGKSLSLFGDSLISFSTKD